MYLAEKEVSTSAKTAPAQLMIHIQQQVWVTKESFEDEELAKKELALLNGRLANDKRRVTYRIITST